MPTITTQIEIAASPAEVRAQFLDFDSYASWTPTPSFIKSIKVTAGDKTQPKEGDTLEVVLPGMTIKPVLLTNTPELFKWRGALPIPGVFDGDHAFHFTPSTTSPGHTTFVQEEVFSGLLTFLIGPTWSQGKKTKAGFEGFNRDLKARVEGKGNN